MTLPSPRACRSALTVLTSRIVAFTAAATRSVADMDAALMAARTTLDQFVTAYESGELASTLPTDIPRPGRGDEPGYGSYGGEV